MSLSSGLTIHTPLALLSSGRRTKRGCQVRRYAPCMSRTGRPVSAPTAGRSSSKISSSFSGVGVALSARGAAASSEAADVVLTVDRLDALADAIFIARRSKTVALQAVGTSMGLSIAAMVAAAAGLLQPAFGAILQEVIDVLAILIALRAVLPGKVYTVTMAPEDVATVLRIREQHDALLPVVEQI
jgi:hypothetical protein